MAKKKRKKSKKSKRRIKSSVILKTTLIVVIVAAVILVGVKGYNYLFKDQKLEELGYSPDAISAMNEGDITDEVGEFGFSELLNYALNQDSSNASNYEYYLISSDEVSVSDVEDIYPIVYALIEKEYSVDEVKLLVTNVSINDLTSLVNEDKVNADQFVESYSEGNEYTYCLTLAGLDEDVYQLVLSSDNELTYEHIASYVSNGYSYSEINKIISNLSIDNAVLLANSKYCEEIAQLVDNEAFDFDLLPRYIMNMRDNDMSVEEVIPYINNNEDYVDPDDIDWSGLYDEDKMEEVSDPSSYTALVNKQYYLTSDYEPSDLVYLPSGYYGNYQQMRSVAANAFISLSDAAVAAGYSRIVAYSNYRSYSSQATIHARSVASLGEQLSDRESARAGHSEHQTGLVTDLGCSSGALETFINYEGYDWLMEHIHEYGFILRFPEGKEYITGYEYENWHIRYVGVEVATIIYEHDWTLEEYKILFD